MRGVYALELKQMKPSKSVGSIWNKTFAHLGLQILTGARFLDEPGREKSDPTPCL